VIKIDRAVDLHDLESVVPYAVARDVVLEAPPTIALAQCACRGTAREAGRGHDCGPLEQCLYLGDPIASFVAEKQPSARLITAEEALDVIDAAAARGAIHSLWFKDAAGGRMYAICNCCSCCCVGLEAQREGFRPIAASGYCATVDAEACMACGACVTGCVFGALSMGPDEAVVDVARCLGCGACLRACPTGALALEPALGGPLPLMLDDRRTDAGADDG
jgi:ferredoxin